MKKKQEIVVESYELWHYRKLHFQEANATMRLTLPEAAFLHSLGRTKAPDAIRRLLHNEDRSNSRAVSSSNSLAWQLAAFLSELGYDMAACKFNKFGKLIEIPLREDEV